MLWISLLIYLLPCCIRQLVELWQCFSTVWMNSCLFILMDDSFISTLPCNSWSYNNLAYIATCIKSLWLRCMTYAQINVSHHYESSVTWRATYITSLLTSYVRKMFLPYLGRHLSGKKKRTLYTLFLLFHGLGLLRKIPSFFIRNIFKIYLNERNMVENVCVRETDFQVTA